MNYKLFVDYQVQSGNQIGIVFTAIVTVGLPTESQAENSPLAMPYRSNDYKIANQTLGMFWGSYVPSHHRLSLPIELKADTVNELKALVDRQLTRIQSVVSEVYQSFMTLPPDTEIEVDPTVTVTVAASITGIEVDPMVTVAASIDDRVFLSELESSPLNDWRGSLERDDRVAVWSLASQRLKYGTIEKIDRGNLGEFNIELRQPPYTVTSSPEQLPIDEQILSFCVLAPDILPACCSSRWDAWRFDFAVGDLVGWRDGDTSRTGYIRELTYNIAIGEIDIIWHGESSWNNYDCMQLFQVD